MMVTVRYFASLREALGSQEQFAMTAGQTVGELRDALIASSTTHAQVLARNRAVRCALNQALASDAALVTDGAEVAFFPPVTGG